jgi:aldehyde:ferredoxin oxidoreductase
MGSKNLKAIAVKGSGIIPVADRERMELIRQKYKAMTGKGYHHIRETQLISPESGITVVKKMHCYRCPRGCYRTLQRSAIGTENTRKCVSANFYKMWDMRLHGHQTEATFRATILANEYSLCALDLNSILQWLDKCFEQGILSERETGLPLAEMGSIGFLETMIKKICLKEGFGEVLAEGALRASKIYGDKSQEITKDFLTQTGRVGAAYSPKVFILTSLIYAIEPRPFIAELHEVQEPLTKWAMWYLSKNGESYVSTDVLRKISERFWGSEKAVDFSTHEGKALAVMKIQNRQYAKESLILCDFTWPIFDDASKDDHIGDPTLESHLLSAITGRETDEKGLEYIGERIFNLNRAILLREGRKGREDDYLSEFYFIERDEPIADSFVRLNPELLLPGRGNEVISRKGKAVDRMEFERIRDEYYKLRGWDIQTGLLKESSLKKLGLYDVWDSHCCQ